MRVAFIADSHGVGLLPFLRERLAAQGDELVADAAIGGWSTRSFANSDETSRVMAARPDLVLLVLGTNDIVDEGLRRKTAELVARIAGPRIVWIGPPHMTKAANLERWAQVVTFEQSTIPQLGVDWRDGRPMTRDLQLRPDGVHFGPNSSRIWATRIASQLRAGPDLTWAWGAGTLAAGFVVAVGGWLWWRSRSRQRR